VLNLSSNKLTGESVEAIAESLGSQSSKITELDLSLNQFDETKMNVLADGLLRN